jgi:PAS domain S-box-containing protein
MEMFCAFYFVRSYMLQRQMVMHRVQQHLQQAISMGKLMIPPGYHDTIASKDSITSEAYQKLSYQYEAICKESKVLFLWTILHTDKGLVFTSWGSSNRQLKPAPFFTDYVSSYNLKELFKEQGMTRLFHKQLALQSFYHSFKDSKGRDYTFIASLEFSQVERLLRENLMQAMYIALGMALLAILLSYILTLLLYTFFRKNRLDNLEESFSKEEPVKSKEPVSVSEEFLVDGKYRFEDLVDVEQLRCMFERFSEATGFTTGLISYPDQRLLIGTGWRDICVKFHRANKDSEKHCKESNLDLTARLKERKSLNIRPCESGLVDGATPIIIKGVHVANLATGQILFEEPDLDFFYHQAKRYGYDTKAYIKALREVPVVDEKTFKKAMLFLSEMAVMLAEQGLANLKTQEMAKILEGQKQNLRITLNSIGEGVISTDLESCITGINPIAEKLTGYSFEEAQGKKLEEVFNILEAEGGKVAKSPVQDVLETDSFSLFKNHTVLVSREGQAYLIESSAAPIRDDEGAVGVVLVFRDVTEEHALREQLNHSQKMKAVGQLAGGIAHDFNNMLGGILGCSEMLERSLQNGKDPKKYLHMIMESAERASSLAQKLLTFSRKKPTAFEGLYLHQVIQETAAVLKNTIDKKIEIKLDLNASSSTILGDLSLLQSLFLNLGINASHAMPEGGVLSFSSRILNLSEAYCNSSLFELEPGQFVEIEVKDTGCGMSAEVQQHIFEPFFTTKKQGKGTGLGLAAVYGAVQQHRGAITVYSEEGRGTSFHITMPLASNLQVENIYQKKEPVKGEGLILVVDDEKVMRATAEALLEECGYSVLVAENGEQALEIFEQHKKDIGLVIVDMIMPEMSGRECFGKLREIKQDVKVILSSGFTRNEDLQAMREEGLMGFIGKPYCGTELSRLVHRVLSGS